MVATPTEVADALAGKKGPVSARFRFERRDHDYGFIDDISNAVSGESPGSLQVDVDRAVVQTCNLTLIASELPVGFDAANDHIAIICEVLINGTWEEFPLGLYHLDSPQRIYSEGHTLIPVSGSDIVIHLIDGTTVEPYHVDAGDNYVTEVEAILNSFSLQHAIPASTKNLPLDIDWAPGTPWYKIVDDLLHGINYFPIWADNTGRVLSREQDDPSTDVPQETFSDTTEPKIIDGDQPYETKEDRTTTVNRVVVLIDDPRHADFGYEARENSDPTSPVSTFNKAATWTEINGDSPRSTKVIYNAAIAAAIARFRLLDAAGRVYNGTLRTFFDPRRAPREAYTLDIDGVEAGTLWRALSYRMDLVAGATVEYQLAQCVDVVITVPA